jgi:hypothetical protein
MFLSHPVRSNITFTGDLSDDLILMNELENIRQSQSNKVNNNSLGK